MTKAGDLNKRATFQRPSMIPSDRGGSKTGPYADYVTLWAELKAKPTYRDREAVRAEQQQTSMTHILTIRYREDITSDMRAIVDGKKLYLVKLPYDPDGKRRWLSMEVEERLT